MMPDVLGCSTCHRIQLISSNQRPGYHQGNKEAVPLTVPGGVYGGVPGGGERGGWAGYKGAANSEEPTNVQVSRIQLGAGIEQHVSVNSGEWL